MRAHWLQHVPFEGLGSIGPWLASAGHEITTTSLFRSADFPDINDIDLLIVMGGPMSVHDEDTFSWLGPEKQFIRRAIGMDIPVLGICLGAQLIAEVLGARVIPNPCKEIGWFPVQGVTSPEDSMFTFPRSIKAFHWHGETFDIPPSAIRIATSEGCKNQGFQLGRSIIGLQFHLEITPQSVRDLIDNCRAELTPARYVQPEAVILGAKPEEYEAANSMMGDVLAYLTGYNG